jgi:hypothetical protein
MSCRDGQGITGGLRRIFLAHNSVYRYIDGETGRRSDTPHHYIYNQADNSNLEVLDRHRVVKVIFEYVNFIFRDFVLSNTFLAG